MAIVVLAGVLRLFPIWFGLPYLRARPDEETADCFAVQRGRREGWLTPDGLEEVCRFISPAKGDVMHMSGSYRCDYMRKCYADPTVR